MTLDIALSLAYVVLASVLVALMGLQRVFRSSPVFFAYVCFDLASSAAGLAIYHYSGFSLSYLRSFLFGLVVDFLLYFCLLAELGMNLLRCNRNTLPLRVLAVLLFAGAATPIIALSKLAATPGRSLLANICFVGMRVDAALQFAGFLALVSWSSLRKLHWPERELRIATGLGFCIFVWFLVSLLEFQWNTGPIYYGLEEAVQAADLVTVAYWLHYFWLVDRGSQARNEHVDPDNRRGRDDSESMRCL